MALPLPPYLQFRSALHRLQGVPPWALLSLVLNGLLFITAMAMLRQLSQAGDAVLPQANAFAADPHVTVAPFEPELGTRHSLDYEEWVALLAAEAEAVVAIDAPNQTVLLGDSLTLWFPTNMLPGRRTWLNQAISGEKSTGLRDRLYLLDNTSPEAVFIMVGINDLIWGGSEADLVYNVRKMVNYLHQKHPQTRVVVQSILPHGGEMATWEGRDRLVAVSPELIRTVNVQLKAVAAETGAEFLDLYPLFVNGDGYLRADLTTDGLHLNQDGYMVWRTALALLNETEFQP
ncbi:MULTISPECIES: GDSL-type esterase/lipase family protein [Cyanophyceae]|uniref:GDSL-type esterase/lipase family protein n=1 Tax=Cyanophyceae TaxID=3028117 RepID=UPI001687A072|nr:MULTISPECIES: GDSL-type esterase/lipase family protein [unclassified Phormidium]MBD1917800.1 lysophospholipase [Phormidium sp. FACHB-77]MBD2032918.1 lysophospholipase [Phormidium sp. FACHB-322]MBD2051666.1 lysophospholipase [Leptolyngbya sp. FACHB-60]